MEPTVTMNDPNESVLEGFLQLQSGAIAKKWKRVFLKLYKEKLIVYENSLTAEPDRVIPLENDCECAAAYPNITKPDPQGIFSSLL